MTADLDQVITAALSAEADALNISDWAEDSVTVRDRRRGVRSRHPWHRPRRSWAVVGAAAVVVAVAATVTVLATRTPGDHRPAVPAATAAYPLPTNGWRSGQPSLGALIGGQFHAVLIDGQACASLGDINTPTLWPAGWQVRFNPTQLIDPDGHIFANEGDPLQAGGGTGLTVPGAVPKQCGSATGSVTSLAHLERGVAPAQSNPPCVHIACLVPSEIARQKANYPPAQPIDRSKPWPSRSAFIAAALRMATAWDGTALSADQRAKITTSAQQMTAREAESLLGENEPFDTLLPDDRPVWVVTVHAYTPLDYAPRQTGPPTTYGYTNISDAPTGFPILQAVGVSALN